MILKKLKKEWKGEVIDVLLAFGVALIAYFSFNYFQPSIEEMLIPIIFLLVLILLKFSNKK
ncbi:MAG: hypothetical protein KKF68_01940 [Nanoarchaeota archaeon]|nr:hypothetical protein [Nanoarchaeota archaeon]